MFISKLFEINFGLALIIELLISGGIVLYFGKQLAKYGDIIAEISGLGGTWVGIIFLAVITSIPELTVSVSSISLEEEADMAIGNIFGSNVFNLMIIAVLDLIQGRGPLLREIKARLSLPASFGTLLISLSIFGMIIGCNLFGIAQDPLRTNIFGWLTSLAILVAWIIGLMLVHRLEKEEMQDVRVSTDVEYKKEAYVYGKFAIFGAVIIFCGVWLVLVSKKLAVYEFHLPLGTLVLGETFVGTIFLALITSFPEFAVTLSAYKLGAPNMALSNLFGSNMFNLLIIPIIELLNTAISPVPQTIFTSIEPYHIIHALLAILLSAIAIIGLTYRSRKSFLMLGYDALFMIIVYLVGNYIFFISTLHF